MKNYMMLSARTSAAHRLLFYLAIVLIFLIRTVAFLFAKNLKGMINMYFTYTPELRKFEREMRQKPNFDRHNYDNNESEIAHFSDNKNLNANINKKDRG